MPEEGYKNKYKIKNNQVNTVTTQPRSNRNFSNKGQTLICSKQSPLKVSNIKVSDIQSYVFNEKIISLMSKDSLIIQRYYRYKYQLLRLSALTESAAQRIYIMKQNAFQVLKTIMRLKQLKTQFLVYSIWDHYKQFYIYQKKLNAMMKTARNFFVGKFLRLLKKSYTNQCTQYSKANSYCNIILFKRRYITFNFIRYYAYLFVQISQCQSISQLEKSLTPSFELEHPSYLLQVYYLNKIYSMYNFENTLNRITLKNSVFIHWFNALQIKLFQNKIRAILLIRFACEPFKFWKDQSTGRHSVMKYRWMYWRFRMSRKKQSKKEFYSIKFNEYYKKNQFFTRLKQYNMTTNILNNIQGAIAVTNLPIVTFILSSINDISSGDTIVISKNNYERKDFKGQVYKNLIQNTCEIRFDNYQREYQLKFKLFLNLKEIVYKRIIFQRIYLCSTSYLKQIRLKICLIGWVNSVQETKYKKQAVKMENIQFYLNQQFWQSTQFIYNSASFGNRFEQLCQFTRQTESTLFYNKYLKIIYSANSKQLRHLYDDEFKSNKGEGDNMLGLIIMIKQFLQTYKAQTLQNEIEYIETQQFKNELDNNYNQRIQKLQHFIPSIQIPTLFYFLKNSIEPKLFIYKKPYFANYYKMTNSTKRIIANIRQFIYQSKFNNNVYRYLPYENQLIPYLSQFISLFWNNIDLQQRIEKQYMSNVFNSQLLLRLEEYNDKEYTQKLKLLNHLFPKPVAYNQRQFVKTFNYIIPTQQQLNDSDILNLGKLMKQNNFDLNVSQFAQLKQKFILIRPSYTVNAHLEFSSALKSIVTNYIINQESEIDQLYKRFRKAELSIKPTILSELLDIPADIPVFSSQITLFSPTKEFLKGTSKSEKQSILKETQISNSPIYINTSMDNLDKQKLQKRIRKLQQQIEYQQQNLNLLSVVKDSDLADELINSVMLTKDIIDPNLQVLLTSPVVWKVKAVERDASIKKYKNKKAKLKQKQFALQQINMTNQDKQSVIQAELLEQKQQEQQKKIYEQYLAPQQVKQKKKQKQKFNIQHELLLNKQKKNQKINNDFDFTSINNKVNQTILETSHQDTLIQQYLQQGNLNNQNNETVKVLTPISIDKEKLMQELTLRTNNKIDTSKQQQFDRVKQAEIKLSKAKEGKSFKKILKKLQQEIKVLNQVSIYEKALGNQLLLDSLSEIIKLLDISQNTDVKLVFQQLELLLQDISGINFTNFQDITIAYGSLTSKQKAEYIIYQIIQEENQNLINLITTNTSNIIKKKIEEFFTQFQQDDFAQAIISSQNQFNSNKVQKSFLLNNISSNFNVNNKENLSSPIYSRLNLMDIKNNLSSKFSIAQIDSYELDSFRSQNVSNLQNSNNNSQYDIMVQLQGNQHNNSTVSIGLHQNNNKLSSKFEQHQLIESSSDHKQIINKTVQPLVKTSIYDPISQIRNQVLKNRQQSIILTDGQKIGFINLVFEINQKGGIFQYLHKNVLPNRHIIKSYLQYNLSPQIQKFFMKITCMGIEEINTLKLLMIEENKQKQLLSQNSKFKIYIKTFSNSEIENQTPNQKINIQQQKPVYKRNIYTAQSKRVEIVEKPNFNEITICKEGDFRPKTSFELPRSRKIIRAGSPCVMFRKLQQGNELQDSFVLRSKQIPIILKRATK
ncbi:hypothetical protein SS50377_26965 [Spironucleus salmonicida]|uniref:Uncharacterized protein n=1 Tax=Spironucleus salmonicida TaxID=348837 RepID=V6LSB5_9EUKA|nr:hypothetical protein SS50377_26965 [Spironucleus salmonicida]|eukprot:EST47475.1 Hypothetical protein SS50377_12461 [Spironucleus salmonicida]